MKIRKKLRVEHAKDEADAKNKIESARLEIIDLKASPIRPADPAGLPDVWSYFRSGARNE